MLIASSAAPGMSKARSWILWSGSSQAATNEPAARWTTAGCEPPPLRLRVSASWVSLARAAVKVTPWALSGAPWTNTPPYCAGSLKA